MIDLADYPYPDARLHLNGFFPFGPIYIWDGLERPEAYYEFDGFVRLAQTAERGLFTAIFLGDSQRLREHLGRINDTAVTGRPDQLVLFAHLAAVTARIGLVATLNTTYSDPVELARRIATVDVLSGGRTGWNLVTTDNAWTGENFRKGGYLGHDDRYRHALEHLRISQRLWDGELVEFHGEFYDVTAAPSVPVSPQVQPVLFQAGESNEGRDFAARYAEAIFSRYIDFDAALDFANDMARRLEAVGRPRDDVKIIPGAKITLGATAAEAQEKAAWFNRQTWGDRRVIAVVESVWGCDLSDHDLDGPLPVFDPVDEEQTKTHGVVNSRDQPLRTAAAWRRLCEERGYSIRQLVAHLGRSREFVGTPASVADELAHYVRSGAIDGLNLAPDSVPNGFDDVVDRLVPALQERGVYPSEYPGTTLRENLGLRAPVAHRQLAEASPVPDVSAGRSFRVDLDGWDAHVLRWEPPTDRSADGRVVLLHGGAGHAHSWAHLAGVLSDRFAVVALDQRGHGRSGPTDRYGSKVLADDVGRLLNALEWPSASLVGHSMGGQAAYLFAAAHSDRVARLVVIDTGPESASEGVARIRANLGGPATFATVDDALAEARHWFPNAEENLLRYRVEHNLRTQGDGTLTWRTSLEVRDGTAFRDDHSQEERWAAWRSLRVPTLLVHGADSDILTDPLVDRFVEGHPALVVTQIPSAGHSIPLEQPDALAAVIAAFLNEPDDPRGAAG